MPGLTCPCERHPVDSEEGVFVDQSVSRGVQVQTRTAGAGGRGWAAFSAKGRGQVFADCNRKGEGCRAGARCRDNKSVALLSFSKRLSPPAKESTRVYAVFSAVARAARGFGAHASQVRTRVRA